MKRNRKLACVSIAAIGMASTAIGQLEPVNGMRPAELEVHAIVGARVTVEPGVVHESATIVIRDGVIEAVGPDITVPEGARRWDGSGLDVYPGLIDAGVLTEIPAPPAGPGRHMNPAIRPETSVVDHVLGTIGLRRELREQGFTAAVIHPKDGIVRGSGAVVALADGEEEQRVYRERGAMSVDVRRMGGWGSPQTPGSLMGAIALVRQLFIDARWHQRATDVYGSHPEGNEPPAPAGALEAMAGAVAGEQPVLFDCADEHAVLRAIALAREFELDPIVLASGMEFKRLDEIVETGVPLIVPLRFPKRPGVGSIHEADTISLRDLMTWEQAPTNARRLVEAGATVALTTERLSRRRDFHKRVADVIEHGLSPDTALAALTTVPAQLFGLEDVMGTIAVGKVANLLVTSGPLFEEDTEVRDTWINGHRYEINPAPAPDLALTGMLETSDGRSVPVVIDGEKKRAVFYPTEGEETRAKSVTITDERFAIVVDGALFERRGWVRLAGAVTDDAAAGTGRDPDGSMFTFLVRADPEAVPGPDDDEEADDDEHEGDAPAGLTGRWLLEMRSDQLPDPLAATLTIDGRPDAWSGAIAIMGNEMALDGIMFDDATGAIEASFEGPAGEATLIGRVDGAVLTATITSAMGRAEVTGERTVGDAGDADDAVAFEMPPEKILVPFGAFTLEPPIARDVLVKDVTIWTCGDAGIIERGAILVIDGRIAAVGADVDAGGRDVLVIDGAGRHVTPGLIDCHSHTGVSGGVNEFPEANTAEVRIRDVINPDDINWYRQLAGGLTACNQLHGSANPIGGQNSVVKLKWGGRATDFVVDGAIEGIKFALGENVVRRKERYPNTRMGVETFLRDAFLAARAYEQDWEEHEALSPGDRARTIPPRRDLELDALVEILNGSRLVHCHSYRQDEILMLIRVAEEFGFTIGTLQHVLEGYKVAEAIAAHGAGASSFSDWWAYKVEVMDAVPYNGTLMTEVGVLTSFNSDSSELARRMNTEAAKAVRYGGLDPHDALELVTINPAMQLRIDARTGSLEKGKDADFVIWSGDPLSTYTRCEQTWVEGVRRFSLEEDAERRRITQRERHRLVQKILALAHGSAPNDPRDAVGEDDEAPIVDPIFEGLDAETIAWLDELVRLGHDPFEVRPGDCGSLETHGHAH